MQFYFSLMFVSLATPLYFSGPTIAVLGPGLQSTHQVSERIGKIAKSHC